MEGMLHPTAESLEGYAEGKIGTADRATIASHLLGCQRCESAVEEWRSLFAALSALPRFAPAPGFTDRVMARVRLPRPWHARAAALAGQALPRSTRGWALIAALLALPILAGGSFMVWLLSKSYVTTHGLWVFVTDRFATAATRVIGSAATFIMQTDAMAWIAGGFDTLLASGGIRGVGALAAGGALLTALSAWVLYTNLFRAPDRDSNYVTFSF